MPPETGTGDALLTNIQSRSKTCCFMISKPAKRRTNYWVRKSKKSCYKTNYWPSKPPVFDTPSEKLKKSPIMNILTKTVATYMFLKNMNNPRQGNEI
jgi:hypothetical protein